MRKWFRKYIRSLGKDIVILFLLNVVFYLFLELVLRRIPAPYPFFVIIGDLFVALAISIMASIVFYFFQVHMPRIKEKENLFPSLASMFHSILGYEKDMLSQLLDLKMDEMTEEKINAQTEKLNLYTPAPLIIGGTKGDHKANWIEYCIFRVQRIDKNWDLMIHYSSYLDSECMALLLRMQNSDMFLNQVRSLFPICNGPAHRLSIDTSSLFIEFWHFIDEQQKYYDRVFAPYMKK